METAVTYDSIRRGDIKAFERLFKEFYPSLCAVAVRFILDHNAAEDIVQEVFIKLWNKRDEYQEIPSLKTFLYVVVKNQCFNYIRDKKQTVDYTCPEVLNREELFKDSVIEEETYRIVDDAVNALPVQSARIIKMSMDGKQNKEIAEILGVSVNTVKTLKYNALSTLRRTLNDYFYLLLLLI